MRKIGVRDMKKIGFLFLCVLALLTGCEKEKKEELIMVTEAGFAPYEYYENGEIVGVDVAIGEEIAKALNKELVVKDVAFDFIINEVQSGKADFGAAGMSITEERQKEVDFTVEYTVSNQVVIVKKGSNIKDFSDISDQTIAVQLGTVADSYVQENYPNAKIVEHKKYLSAVEDVKSGKADLLVMDKLPAEEIVKQNTQLKILDGVLFQDRYGMIVKKGNKKLLNQINAVLEDLMEQGKIEDFVLQYSKEEAPTGFFAQISNKFYQTFIYQDRYLYFLEGLKSTVIMALAAAVLGFVLGTIVALIRDFSESTGKIKILKKICDIYVYVIRGTPTLLQLMILYYVIFRTSSISVFFVGILTFGINSGAYVAEIIRAGFDAVGKGQREAAKTLSLSYPKMMRYIIFPQAIQKVFPTLGNEAITLLKETSIAGYIGIVELIKASDIVSSSTYDYFFPLIVSAILYLLLTFLLSKGMHFIERRMEKYVQN